MAQILIDGIRIGPSEPIYVMADIGSNHNKNIEIAKELIRECKKAGVRAIKLQTYREKDLYSKKSPKWSMYNKTPYDLISEIQWPDEWQDGRSESELSSYSRKNGITLLTTPFSERATDTVMDLVPALKVASFEVGSHKFLRHLGQSASKNKKPIIMSTGARYMDEVMESVDTLMGAGATEIILLHCVSNYPSNPEDCNLRAIKTHAERFHFVVGFSDHVDMHEAITKRLGNTYAEAGIISGALAVLMGASVLEKHITLDRKMKGPDHAFAIEPEELKIYVELAQKSRETYLAGSGEELLEKYRNEYKYVDDMLGDGKKRPTASERESRLLGQRFLYVNENLRVGSRIKAINLEELRGGVEDAIKPRYAFKEKTVIGKPLVKPIDSGEILTWSHLGLKKPSEKHTFF